MKSTEKHLLAGPSNSAEPPTEDRLGSVSDSGVCYIALGEDGEELTVREWESGPRPRSWRELLNDRLEFDQLKAAARVDVLDDWGLEEIQLDAQVPFSTLLDWYPNETPNGSLFFALQPLQSDPRTKALIEFVEGACPGSDYRGVRMKGSFLALNELLREYALGYEVAPEHLWNELEDTLETNEGSSVLEAAKAAGESPMAYVDLHAAELQMEALDEGQIRDLTNKAAVSPMLLAKLAAARAKIDETQNKLRPFKNSATAWAEVVAGRRPYNLATSMGWNARKEHVYHYIWQYILKEGSLPAGTHDLGRTTKYDIPVGLIDFDDVARRAAQVDS